MTVNFHIVSYRGRVSRPHRCFPVFGANPIRHLLWRVYRDGIGHACVPSPRFRCWRARCQVCSLLPRLSSVEFGEEYFGMCSSVSGAIACVAFPYPFRRTRSNEFRNPCYYGSMEWIPFPRILSANAITCMFVILDPPPVLPSLDPATGQTAS